jgi:glycosyltransferase involved in cell wall biosynthesis
VPAHRTDASALRFWRSHALGLWRMIRLRVRSAGVVHSGLSDDLWRPLMAMVNLAAWRAGRPVIFVVDIDFRQHAKRYYRLGAWGLKSYLVNRIVYDPMKWLQVWLAPRMFQLVLLKSASMVKDFGRGRPHVKNFYDTVHALEDVLTDAELAARLVYFGRLIAYKGLDRAIEGVRLARARGADVRLALIGEGDCLASLQQQVVSASLQDAVTFEPQVRYGAPLFERLRHAHLTVATPLLDDTPRAAFDSMARGIPMLAFDISYFRDLAHDSRAVVLADWPDAASVANHLCELSRQRERIADMARHAVAFARRNTQAVWLAQRARWVEELAGARPTSAADA